MQLYLVFWHKHFIRFSGFQINNVAATHCTNCCKHQIAQAHEHGAVDAWHNHPLGCSVTSELPLCISHSCFYLFISRLFQSFSAPRLPTFPVVSHLMLSILISPSLSSHLDWNKHFPTYFSACPYQHVSLSLPSIRCWHFKHLCFYFCCFSPSIIFVFLLVFYISGAGCLPSSCRKRQQDVFCHHRPVKDQQHVPLQPCFFSAPLPKGSSGQEGECMPNNS